MCLAQGPQRSDAGEARIRGPSVSSQALYHWATALPVNFSEMHNFWCVTLAIRLDIFSPKMTGIFIRWSCQILSAEAQMNQWYKKNYLIIDKA